MKKSLKNPLARMLNAALIALWWGEWAFGAVAAFLLLWPDRSFSPRIPVPVKFDKVTIRELPRIDSQEMSSLVTNHGSISIPLESSWQRAIMLLCAVLIWAGVMAITFQVKNIVASFVRNEPFDKRNLYRIRVIAFILIFYFVCKVLFMLLMQTVMNSIFNFDHMQLAYDTDNSFLYVGVIMLVLEAVFKRGVYLEDEEQLTI